MVDAAEGVLGIEWVHGQSIRFLLGGGAEGEEEEETEAGDGGTGEDGEEVAADVAEDEDPLKEYGVDHGECPLFSCARRPQLKACIQTRSCR